jgi:bis(5'-nucleosyl)-tetraphosphatase (symmetrical)
MAIYFVGDIQGCYSELVALLEQVNFNKNKDQLWVAGDMVARGPDSYKTVKFLISLGNSVKAVLGNHDLHLLSIYAGLKKVKKSDFFDELLNAPDVEMITHWLAQQPLLRKLPNEAVYMSHAGLSPQWQIAQAVEHAAFAHQCLKSPNREYWLKVMYGEKPNSWQQVSSSTERFRYTINAFTRMRYCFDNGDLEFDSKQAPNDAPSELQPWYEIAKVQLSQCQWIFGHWAALMGNVKQKNIYALDTGCVWGEYLTLLRWSDKKLFIEHSHKNLR